MLPSREREIFKNLDDITTRLKVKVTDDEKQVMKSCKTNMLKAEGIGGIGGLGIGIVLTKAMEIVTAKPMPILTKGIIGFTCVVVSAEVYLGTTQKDCMRSLLSLPNSSLAYTARGLMRKSHDREVFIKEYNIGESEDNNM